MGRLHRACGEKTSENSPHYTQRPRERKMSMKNVNDMRYKDLTTSSALFNWVSAPAPSDSGEFSTTKSGSTPLPSIHSPCQVYQPAMGMRSTYPQGNLK